MGIATAFALAITFVLIVTVFKGVLAVPQQSVWIVEKMGKFDRTLEPGIFSVGETILNVPDYTATLSADYDRPIAEDTNLFVRADFPYTGRSHAYYASSSAPFHYSPNYGVVNLNVGVTKKKLSVAIYGKNLANNKKIIQYPLVNTVQEGYTLRPLTVGVTASYQF